MTTFTNETQKDRRAYADYWGVEIADVYFCDDCGYWTHLDEDELPVCKCGQSARATRPTQGPQNRSNVKCENLQKIGKNFVKKQAKKWHKCRWYGV